MRAGRRPTGALTREDSMEIRKKVCRRLLMRRAALGLTAAMLAMVIWPASSYGQPNSELARLYQLQAAFHRAGTVSDPVNGDSDDGYRSAHQRHAVAVDRRRLRVI